MIIVLAATANMYPQLQRMITMLIKTQTNLKHIYALVEGDFDDTGVVSFINIRNYPKISHNNVNGNNSWTYISFGRCYLAELLPNIDKVLYLDLDLCITDSLDELWNIDIDNYAIGGVIDINARNYFLPYVSNINTYINSGVLLMNLQFFRKHDYTNKMHKLLNSYIFKFPDQDVLNIVSEGYIKYLSNKWNSGAICGYYDYPVINHCSTIKPWDPTSIWFKEWAQDYLSSGAVFSNLY